jgi:hypothetical protein
MTGLESLERYEDTQPPQKPKNNTRRFFSEKAFLRIEYCDLVSASEVCVAENLLRPGPEGASEFVF